jgi:tetratricopeptide (TPR) repeat protein
VRKFFGYFSEFSIFAVVGLILIIGPLNFGSREPEAQALIHMAALATLPLWMIRLVCLAEPVFVWTRVTLPALAFVGYVLLWFGFSEVKWLARQDFLMVLSYLVLFLVVLNCLQRRWQLQALFWIIVAVAGAEAADAIIRHYRGSMNVVCRFFFFDCLSRQGFQNLVRAGGTFFTPDHFSAYLEIGLVLIAAHIVVLKRSWTRKVFLVYVGGCVLYAIALSQSRGGWITVLCVIPFLVVMVVRGRFLNFRSALVGVLVLGGVVYLLYAKHGLVSERLRDLVTQGEPTRLKLYSAALQIGKDHPVLGSGPRMFNCHLPRHFGLAENPEFVHSEFLQLWSDYGFVGVALVGWLLFALYRSAYQMCTPRTEEAVSNVSKDVSLRLALALGGVTAAFAVTVHAAFDFVVHVMGIATTLVVALALGYAASALRRKRSETELDAFGFEQACRYVPLSPRTQHLTLAALGLTFLVFFPLSMRTYLAIRYEQRAEALMYAAAGDWNDPEAALTLLQKAVRMDRRSYRVAIALGNYYAAQAGNDPDANRDQFDQALHWYSEAIRVHPYFSQAYTSRIPLYLAAGEAAKARVDCERLTKIWPFNAEYRLRYGEVCIVQADYDCARRELEVARKLAEEAPASHVAEIAKNYLDLLQAVPRPEDPDSN